MLRRAWTSLSCTSKTVYNFVICPPTFQLFARIRQAEEDLAVQALIAEPAVETLDITVLNGTAWSNGDMIGLQKAGVSDKVIGEFSASLRTG